MNDTESTTSGSVVDEGTSKTTPSSSKDEAAAGSHAHIHMIEKYLLIWLNSNIDEENNEDCRHAITQLRHVINSIEKFTDGDECLKFIKSIENQVISMVISSSFGQDIVWKIHEMPQVDFIFVFCDNQNQPDAEWTKKCHKIKGVFTEISQICKALKQETQQDERNAISVNFVVLNEDGSDKNVQQLEPSFMYTQMLKENLLDIKFNEQHIKEFIDYCRKIYAEDEKEMNNIKLLEQTYRTKTPSYWYSYECFLYPMLNQALRLTKVDIMIKMGFFIGDLHRDLEKLHKEQFGGQHSGQTFPLYRGQGLSKIDFDKMMKTKGGLMSFNNFLSTSKNIDVSIKFAKDALKKYPDAVPILFIVTIDPSIVSTPFASITAVSAFGDKEAEVLFSTHAVFRIHDIEPRNDDNSIYQVNLTLTSDNDPQLGALTKRMREEIAGPTAWDRLGRLLLKMGYAHTAQEIYEMMLKNTTDERELSYIYHQLGRIKDDQHHHEEALEFYGKTLEIRKRILPSNDPDLVKTYANIGAVYAAMEKYGTALSYYEKTIEIREKTIPPNYLDLAKSYNNIAAVYHCKNDFSKAMLYNEKTLEILQKHQLANHPDVALLYYNIGRLYESNYDCQNARSCYQRAFNIGQHSLQPNHPHLDVYRASVDRLSKF